MGQKNKKVQTTPTLAEYLAQRAQQVRDSAANVYALKDMPEVPIIPEQNIFSKGLAWLGLSDDSRIKIAGKEETPLTCIYTTTNQYGDEGAKVPGNITFKNNPRKYGFEPIPMNIDSIGKGDLIQFAPSKKNDPIHAGMVTGTYKDEFNDRELPTLTYSRGGTGITTQTDEGTKPTMVHNRPWGEIVEKKDYRYPTAYRYVGSPQKQQEWTNEYNNKYGTQRSNGRLGVTARWAEGGFLQPRDAWDKLSIEEQAAMMKAAVSEGIFDISEIRKRYNEFAEGGSKEKVVNTDEQYLRTMEKVAEDNYQKWGFSNPDEALLHALNDNTYNYRGYYGKYPQSKANADTHWTDEFKTVYHPTFSNESTYSGQKSQYNPLGLSGGFWSGDTFVPMAWQLDANEYKKGGKIHIKPENRGKFTALKERTGHSATWFKEHGTPAQKKMAVFALNSRHWKHGLGGNLFDGTTEDSQQMQIGLKATNGWKPYTLDDILANAARIEQQKQVMEDRLNNVFTLSNDATSVANGRPQNTHLERKAIEGAKAHRAWEENNPTMTAIGNITGAAPFIVMAVPIADAAASSAVGQLTTKFLTHPITETAGVAMAGGHGLNDLFSGKANAVTALELAPLISPYGNFARGTKEAINYLGSKIPTTIKDAWANRAEKTALFFGEEGKTWAKVTDPKGKEGIVFLNNNAALKGLADWSLHPMQTYRNWSQGFYPMTRKGWKSYLSKERAAMDFAKQKSIELNDAQLQQRLSLQPETFLDNKQRSANATIKIIDDPNNVFSWPRAPRNASEVANNVRVVSRDKDVSYGGKWFDPKFGTGTAAVSHPDKNVIVLPRHDQTKFSNMLMTMPNRGYTSPIDTRMHTYTHELQHQMQQNLPLLNLSQYNDAVKYYEPWNHFLRNIDSENLLQPFKNTASEYPGSWLASPNEYNAESNAYRIVDDYKGRRNILDPLDINSANRLSNFGLNFEQLESLWDMGYKKGGHLKKIKNDKF